MLCLILVLSARLSFNTTPPSKKRKHDDEANNSDVIKFRKTLDGHELEQNQTPCASESVNIKNDEVSNFELQYFILYLNLNAKFERYVKIFVDINGEQTKCYQRSYN